MIKLRFEYDFGSGFAVGPPPRNWKAIQQQLIFAIQQGQLNLQTQLQGVTFEFVREMGKAIRDHKDRGMTGGTGVFEGPGHRMYAGDAGILIFDGCLDTASENCLFDRDIVRVPIRENKVDWINDVANSITFEYLTSLAPGSPGYLSRADYKQVPYAVSSIPDYDQAMLLSISLFVIIKESVDVIARVVSLVARAISQSLSWLQLIGTIIEIILYLIYLVAIVAASAKLIQEIADNLLQPKKTKLGMREVDLFVKGFEYFNLKFVSSIYGYGTADGYSGRFANATLIPAKIKLPAGDPSLLNNFIRPPDETVAADSYGYYEGTFKQFLDDMCMMYDGQIVIRGNTAYFENIHSWNRTNPFQLPNEGEVGYTYNYPEPYTTNAHEIPLVYVVRFQKDDQELNTYNDYTGTYCIAQTVPNIVHAKRNQLARGSKIVDLPFALARRKINLTILEQKLAGLLDQFGSFLQAITSSVDHATSQMSDFMPDIISNEDVGLSNTQVGFFASQLLGNPAGSLIALIFGTDGLPIIPTVVIPYFSNDRVGWMLLSNDFIGVPKRFIGEANGADWFVSQNNESGDFVTIVTGVPINGTFAGSYTGLGGGGAILPTPVVNGNISVSFTNFLTGPHTIVISGIITGYTGTFTCVVTGSTSIGTFTGTGFITTIGSTTPYSTNGWGSAKQLMLDFHSLNLMDNNQYLLFKNKKFKMGMVEYSKIRDNNVFQTADGKWGKFEKILWDLHNDQAIGVDYRIKQKYTNNYTTIITEDAG